MRAAKLGLLPFGYEQCESFSNALAECSDARGESGERSGEREPRERAERRGREREQGAYMFVCSVFLLSLKLNHSITSIQQRPLSCVTAGHFQEAPGGPEATPGSGCSDGGRRELLGTVVDDRRLLLREHMGDEDEHWAYERAQAEDAAEEDAQQARHVRFRLVDGLLRATGPR